MKFDDLLALVGDEPLFETALLLAGDVRAAEVHRQLARWRRAGRIVQLRRGVYALAAPFRRVAPHPFVLANRMEPGSYVSTESALAHHGLIPEHVPVTTSVGACRPGRFVTDLGSFQFRHVKRELRFGYRLVDLGGRQSAFVATPEKALLDLVYLRSGAARREFLSELRLQNLERIDAQSLHRMATRTASPKLRRAAGLVDQLAREEAEEYQSL